MGARPQAQAWASRWTAAGAALVVLNVGLGIAVYVYYDVTFGWSDLIGLVLIAAWLGWPAWLAWSRARLVGAILAGLGPVVLLLIVLAVADCKGVCSGGGANGFNNEWLLMIVVGSAIPFVSGLLFLIASVRRAPDAVRSP